MDLPGIEIRPIRQMTGDADFNEVFFTDVRIPADNLVGDVNRGWALAKVTLGNERVSLSGGGALWGMGPSAVDLLDVVRAGGGCADPILRQRLAQLHIESEILRLIRLRTLTSRIKGEQPGPEASIRKILADEHGQHIMGLAKDLAGAGGLLTGQDAGRAGLALRLPVLRGADDRRRHGRGAAQHRGRAGARAAARRRRRAGQELVRGPPAGRRRRAVSAIVEAARGVQPVVRAHADEAEAARGPARRRRRARWSMPG